MVAIATANAPDPPRTLWELARRQHGVVSHAQLVEYGLSRAAIRHRVSKGRLHPVDHLVYAVGRPELSRHGRWVAALLSCSLEAALSHESAAALLGLEDRETRIVISVPRHLHPRRASIRIHRVDLPPTDTAFHESVRCTTPARTLIDLASRFGPNRAEAAVNAADKLGLLTPEQLRADLESRSPRPGLPTLRALLDRDTFRLTDSELERRFLRLVARAGLPAPQTGVRLNGFKVDFFWPDLGLVVETDGLRYHRTASQQARDRERDQAHTAAGLTSLRFSHARSLTSPTTSSARSVRSLSAL